MPSPDGNTADFFLSFSLGLWPCLTQFKLLFKLFFFFLAAQRKHFLHKLLDKKTILFGGLTSFSTFL